MAIEKESEQERFEEFLRTFKDEQGNTPYWSRIQNMSINDETSLVIDFQDLMSFDTVFIALASEDPVSFLNMMDDALISTLRIEDPDYVATLPPRSISARIINYPEHVALRALRSRHIGRLIHISGIMMRASEVKPLLVEAVFRCRICLNEIPQIQEEGRYTEPPLCTVCGKKTSMKLVAEKSRFIDWQKVRIQESPEELPPGQMPRSVDVILQGDIVDISRPGDLVKVNGILQTAPDFTRRGGRLATFKVFIDANGVEITEKEYEQLEISEEDEQKIRELAEDQYVHERIFASIAPSIQGNETIKESIALLLFGGVSKTLPDGTRLRGKSNILMIGDPGTGKSQILKFVSGLASRALYTSGKGTTAAGLTAAVIHDADTGAMTLEAGALVLADQGIACIDEFDKMDPNDRTAIHEAMEQHSFHPSTEILFSNGSRKPIGEFIDTLFDEYPEKVVQGVNCEILDTASMDIEINTTDFFDVKKSKLDRVSRHPAPDHFIRIVYDNGRDIVVTPDHPVFVFNNGTIETVPADTIKVGDFVPAPRKMPCGHNPGAELVSVIPTRHLAKQLDLPTRLTVEMARLLGYYVTEGYSYDGSSAEIGFSTTSTRIRDDTVSLMRNIFGLEGLDYMEQNRTIRFISTHLMEFFQTNFPEVMAHARNKRVPSQIFISGEKAVQSFLQSAFLGDGSVESESLCYRTASRGLAHDFQDLLHCLGIQSRILHDSYNDSYKVYIRGSSLPLFKDIIIESWDERQKGITRIINRSKSSNYNHDSLPPSIAMKIKKLYKKVGLPYRGTFYRAMHEKFGITRTLLKKHLHKVKKAHYEAVRHINETPSSIREIRSILGWSQETAGRKIRKTRSFMNYLERGGYTSTIERDISNQLRRAVQNEIENISQEISNIEAILTQNIRCLRVKTIEKIKNTGSYTAKYAYDITVEPEHSFISQGLTLHNTVSIAKAGIVATLNARTSILAAANPALGRYESSLSVQDNIRLPFTILSRFDLIWIMVDTVEASKDRELAQFILDMHQMKPTEGATPPIAPDFLKKYIGYANRYVIPKLSAEAAEVIENFYVDLRRSAEGGAPVPITARQLESLVRLAEARARMALRSNVTKEDAQASVRLMEDSLRMVALDSITGKIDIDRLVSKMSAAQRSSSDIILKAIRDMEAEGTLTVSEDALIQRVLTMGLSRERAEEVIRKLLAEGILFNPREGKIRRAQS
jgi:replicative DNA helicase Mcm